MPTPKGAKAPPKAAGKEVKDRPDHYVYIEKSITKNLGDYNSSKITVGLTLRVNPTPQEMKDIRATVDIINEYLDKEMEEQVKALE